MGFKVSGSRNASSSWNRRKNYTAPRRGTNSFWSRFLQKAGARGLKVLVPLFQKREKFFAHFFSKKWGLFTKSGRAALFGSTALWISNRIITSCSDCSCSGHSCCCSGCCSGCCSDCCSGCCSDCCSRITPPSLIVVCSFPKGFIHLWKNFLKICVC